MKINWKRLLLSVGICEAVGLAGGIVTGPAIKSWYAYLSKPAFTPPSWLFGPVWITLYLLMGVALYLILGKSKNKKKFNDVTALFIVQLFLNGLWSYLFFGLHNPLLALVEVLVLLGVIILTIARMIKIEITAAYLMLPYLAWTAFATILNFAIVLLN